MSRRLLMLLLRRQRRTENFTDGSGAQPASWWNLAETSGPRADASTSNNTLDESAAITRVAGPNANVPYGAAFTGTDRLTRDDASLSADFPGKNGGTDASITFGAWVNPVNLTGLQGFLGKGDSYSLFLDSGAPRMTMYGDGWGTWAHVVSGAAVSTGTWTHIVGRWNQATGAITVFANGVSVATGTLATMNQETNFLSVGFANETGSPYFNGSVAEPFVFAALLTDAQISSIYTAGLSG